MKYIQSIITLVVGCALASCSSDEKLLPHETETAAGEPITLRVGMEQGLSRMVYQDEFRKVLWEVGDQLNVTLYAKEPVSFTLKSGEGTTVGVFEGTLPEGTASNESTKLTYQGSEVNKEGFVPTQSSTEPTRHLSGLLELTSDLYTVEQLQNSLVLIKPQNTLMRVDLKFIPEELKQITTVEKVRLANLSNPADFLDLKVENGKLPDRLFFTTTSKLTFPDSKVDDVLALQVYGKDFFYQVKGKATADKKYEPGMRYTFTVQETEQAGFLAPWADVTAQSIVYQLSEGASVGNLSDNSIQIDPSQNQWRYYSYQPLSEVTALFKDQTELIQVSLPAGLMSIPDECFGGCSALASIAFPDGLTAIGEKAFQGCTQLASLDLNQVQTVYASAFGQCTGLKEVVLRACTQTLGANIFDGCTLLNKLTILAPEFTSSSAQNGEIFTGVDNTEQVDLRLNIKWVRNKSYPADVNDRTWMGKTWKSITLVNENNQELSDQLPDLGEGGTGF